MRQKNMYVVRQREITVDSWKMLLEPSSGNLTKLHRWFIAAQVCP